MPEQPHYAKPYYEDRETAASFDATRFPGRFGAYLRVRDEALFVNHPRLNPQDVKNILDAGAGTGRLTIPLCRAFPLASVVALDFSPAMLDRLVERSARDLPNTERLTVRVGDVSSTGFSDRQFDLVVSSRCLMHVPNWRAGLQELCRVSGRYLLFDVPARRSLGYAGLALLTALRPNRERVETYRHFTTREVREVLTDQGFAVREQRKALLLPIPLHLRLNQPAVSRGAEWVFRALGLTAWIGSPIFFLAERRSGSIVADGGALRQAQGKPPSL